LGKNRVNYVYYLCLIHWQKVLTNEELNIFNEDVKNLDKSRENYQSLNDNWTKIQLQWENDEIFKEIISESELGFYHSRLIFKFRLKGTPNTLMEVREKRINLETKIEQFCQEEIIEIIKKIDKDAKAPIIFIYPIFELNRKENFWNFERKRPFSLPTTCFYTKLDDPDGKKVQMRISGAKIIAMDMSDWFFETLVNIIFHEGLYRQTRDKNKKIVESNKQIYGGLENRLEDFASKLMTTFHEYSSDNIRRKIQKLALWATIFGILLGIAFFWVNFCFKL